ncbi:MAG: (2Fe-2S)-binding protein [Vicinamibacteria bacterium]|nr:(2Fe-2S)-binding protein [Vicinamibacteria bacterium]
MTVQALARPGSVPVPSGPALRFCAVAACPVVYFGPGFRLDRQHLRVPVFQKEPAGDRIVCYCFGITESTLRREQAELGGSPSEERIRGEVRAGRCACEIENPQGTCCLGNVTLVLRAIAPTLVEGRK